MYSTSTTTTVLLGAVVCALAGLGGSSGRVAMVDAAPNGLSREQQINLDIQKDLLLQKTRAFPMPDLPIGRMSVTVYNWHTHGTKWVFNDDTPINDHEYRRDAYLKIPLSSSPTGNGGGDFSEPRSPRLLSHSRGSPVPYWGHVNCTTNREAYMKAIEKIGGEPATIGVLDAEPRPRFDEYKTVFPEKANYYYWDAERMNKVNQIGDIIYPFCYVKLLGILSPYAQMLKMAPPPFRMPS